MYSKKSFKGIIGLNLKLLINVDLSLDDMWLKMTFKVDQLWEGKGKTISNWIYFEEKC